MRTLWFWCLKEIDSSGFSTHFSNRKRWRNQIMPLKVMLEINEFRLKKIQFDRNFLCIWILQKITGTRQLILRELEINISSVVDVKYNACISIYHCEIAVFIRLEPCRISLTLKYKILQNKEKTSKPFIAIENKKKYLFLLKFQRFWTWKKVASMKARFRMVLKMCPSYRIWKIHRSSNKIHKSLLTLAFLRFVAPKFNRF